MKKTFALLTYSAFVLSGCQQITKTETKTQYSELWTAADVAADQSVHSKPAVPFNPDTDPNRVLTSKTEAGNREYLIADSIKSENGIIMALIEYRYAKPQKLPSNGATYTHNHWFEQIDCQNHIRTIRTTTHYNAQGEIVDANEYPTPSYTPAQMKLLAQPDDGVIKEVCKRIGFKPQATPVATPPAPNKPNAATPPKAESASAPETPTKPNNKKDKNNKNNKEKTENAKTEAQKPQSNQIDFTKQNQDNKPQEAPKPQTKPETPPPQPQNTPSKDLPSDDFWDIAPVKN